MAIATESRMTKPLDRLSEWKDKGATLLFTFSDPRAKVAFTVEVQAVSEDSVSFRWVFGRADAQGSFITTHSCFFTIWLKAATVSLSDHPEFSVTIVHGEYQVVLTVLRASAFGD